MPTQNRSTQRTPRPPRKGIRPATARQPADQSTRGRLSRQQWIDAALQLIAQQGLSGVNIANMAAALRVTTGSFYWHFGSREELIEAALDRWETERIDVIEGLREIADPRQRLERLISDSYRHGDRGRLFAALQASASDPRVASRLRRTTQRRLTFLTQTYRQLGHSLPQARHYALSLYSLYAGLWEVARTLPSSDEHAPTGRQLTGYLQHLRKLILPAARPPAARVPATRAARPRK